MIICNRIWRKLVSVITTACLVFANVCEAQEPETPAELHLGSLPVNRVLFLGNSITLHAPAPDIGWTGNWGMAASGEDKDYVHLLLDKIAVSSGGRPRFMVRNIAEFERELGAFNIEEQLKNYRSGKRRHEVMSVVAKPLSDAEIADLAAWYASIRIEAAPP